MTRLSDLLMPWPQLSTLPLWLRRWAYRHLARLRFGRHPWHPLANVVEVRLLGSCRAAASFRLSWCLRGCGQSTLGVLDAIARSELAAESLAAAIARLEQQERTSRLVVYVREGDDQAVVQDAFRGLGLKAAGRRLVSPETATQPAVWQVRFERPQPKREEAANVLP